MLFLFVIDGKGRRGFEIVKMNQKRDRVHIQSQDVGCKTRPVTIRLLMYSITKQN